MQNEIFLTIGIPTFNGSKYLQFAIESIIKEIPLNEEKNYEILISDNASTDNTKQIVLEFQKKYPNQITYILNDNNLGFDRNVDNLIRKSKGKFVKLLGDDDELMPGSIKYLTEILLLKPSLIAIVHSVKFVNIKTNKVIETHHNILKTKIYKNGDEFFQKSKWATAAFASLVICREKWVSLNLEKYFGLKWIHIGGLIEMLKCPGYSMGISDQLVIVRLENDRWSENNGTIADIMIGHSKVLQNLIHLGYKKKTYHIFLMDRYEHYSNEILLLKSDLFFENIKKSISMIKNYWMFPTFWIIVLPTFVLGKKFIFFGRKFNHLVTIIRAVH